MIRIIKPWRSVQDIAQFHQFWLNAADEDIATYLRWFTFLDQDAIEDIEWIARHELRIEERNLNGRDVLVLASND